MLSPVEEAALGGLCGKRKFSLVRIIASDDSISGNSFANSLRVNNTFWLFSWMAIARINFSSTDTSVKSIRPSRCCFECCCTRAELRASLSCDSFNSRSTICRALVRLCLRCTACGDWVSVRGISRIREIK